MNTKSLIHTLIVYSCTEAIATVTMRGVDTSKNANWRTSINTAYSPDGKFGVDGFMIFGLSANDGIYSEPFNIANTNSNNYYSIPQGLNIFTLTTNIRIWSGNANFGFMQNPNYESALSVTPFLANGFANFSERVEAGNCCGVTYIIQESDDLSH